MSNNITTNDLFETSDLNLACVLLSLGYSLDCIDKTSSSSKAKFRFLRREGLDEAIQAFWARDLKLEPLSILTNLKILKNRLYSDEL
jgi:hypothetical protein